MFKKGTKSQVQSYAEIITFKCIDTKESAEMESKTDKKASQDGELLILLKEKEPRFQEGLSTVYITKKN